MGKIAVVARRGYLERPVADDRMLSGAEGLVGHAIRTGASLLVPDVRDDPRYILGRRETLSEMVVPIRFEGRAIAALDVESDRLGAFDDADLERLEFFAEAAAMAIDKAMLHRRLVELEQVDAQVRLARQVQLGLLPRQAPELAGWEIAGLCRPSLELGGDLYDHFPLAGNRARAGKGPGKRWAGLVIGDVAGKGVPAALIMATFRALLRARREPPGLELDAGAAPAAGRPAVTLAAVSRLLRESTATRAFVTCCYAVLEGESGEIVYASCGHPPGLVSRRGCDAAALEELENCGPALGAFEHEAFVERRLRLDSGDSLLLFTDGLTEALSRRRAVRHRARPCRFRRARRRARDLRPAPRRRAGSSCRRVRRLGPARGRPHARRHSPPSLAGREPGSFPAARAAHARSRASRPGSFPGRMRSTPPIAWWGELHLTLPKESSDALRAAYSHPAVLSSRRARAGCGSCPTQLLRGQCASGWRFRARQRRAASLPGLERRIDPVRLARLQHRDLRQRRRRRTARRPVLDPLRRHRRSRQRNRLDDAGVHAAGGRQCPARLFPAHRRRQLRRTPICSKSGSTAFSPPTRNRRHAEVPSPAYTLRLDAYADGGAHTLAFEFEGPAGGGFAAFNLDGVTLVVRQVVVLPAVVSRTRPGLPLDSPSWVEASTQFCSPICSLAVCGDGAGSVSPRTGDFWAWFGGVSGSTPETSSVSQTVSVPFAAYVDLEFQMGVGAVQAPFTDELHVRLDGTRHRELPRAVRRRHDLRTVQSDRRFDRRRPAAHSPVRVRQGNRRQRRQLQPRRCRPRPSSPARRCCSTASRLTTPRTGPSPFPDPPARGHTKGTHKRDTQKGRTKGTAACRATMPARRIPTHAGTRCRDAMKGHDGCTRADSEGITSTPARTARLVRSSAVAAGPPARPDRCRAPSGRRSPRSSRRPRSRRRSRPARRRCRRAGSRSRSPARGWGPVGFRHQARTLVEVPPLQAKEPGDRRRAQTAAHRAPSVMTRRTRSGRRRASSRARMPPRLQPTSEIGSPRSRRAPSSSARARGSVASAGGAGRAPSRGRRSRGERGSGGAGASTSRRRPCPERPRRLPRPARRRGQRSSRGPTKTAKEELAEERELEDEGEKERWGPLRKRGGRGAYGHGRRGIVPRLAGRRRHPIHRVPLSCPCIVSRLRVPARVRWRWRTIASGIGRATTSPRAVSCPRPRR